LISKTQIFKASRLLSWDLTQPTNNPNKITVTITADSESN